MADDSGKAGVAVGGVVPASADVQDPLPESNFFWRRAFTFVVVAAVLYLSYLTITRLGSAALAVPQIGVPALLTAFRWLIGFTALLVTYYMLAPSAEQMVKLLQTAKLLQGGVTMRRTAEVTTDAGTARTTTTTGPVAAPAPDPAPVAPQAPSPPVPPPGGSQTPF